MRAMDGQVTFVQLYKTVSSFPLAIFLNGSEPLSEGPKILLWKNHFLTAELPG